MSNKKRFPQLGQHVHLAGRRDVFTYVVLEIKSKDEFGRPREVVAYYDEEKIDIKQGQEFWVVLSPTHMTVPKPKGLA